jgi:hypothetical protein
MRNYRADIDGLRAFAVLGVLLFHAGYSAFAGGFVGVDVFFIISGYLISGGILEDVKSGQFSYAGFYDNVLLDGKPVAPGGDAYSAVEAGINRLIEGSSPERRFVLVGAQPMMRHCLFQISRELPAPIAHARGTDSRCPPKPRNEAESEGAAVERMLRRIAARWQGRVVLLSPVDFLCDESCPVFRGDLPMFRDAGHLTVAGSQFVGTRAAGLFEALLRDWRTAPPSEASAKP